MKISVSSTDNILSMIDKAIEIRETLKIKIQNELEEYVSLVHKEKSNSFLGKIFKPSRSKVENDLANDVFGKYGTFIYKIHLANIDINKLSILKTRIEIFSKKYPENDIYFQLSEEDLNLIS